MSSRLFKKFFLTSAGIFVAGLTLLSAILGVGVVNYLVSDIKKDLNKNCSAVADAIKSNAARTDMVSGMAAALSGATDSEIFLTDLNGNVVICGCEDWLNNGSCNLSEKTVPASVISEIKTNGEFFDNGTLDGFFYRGERFSAALPIFNSDGQEIGFVFSTAPASQIRSFFIMLMRVYLFVAIIPIMMIFFAEYALSYRLVKPLRQMSDAAKRMAKGDFSRRIPVISDDEIGDLSISFNNMANSLVQLESMQRSFIGNVSHELRTPMTTIGGFIDGILDGTIDKDMQEQYLKIVSDEVKRLSRLVESMLCLAKLESGEQKIMPQKIDVAKIARNVVISQEKRIEEKGINITGLDVSEQTVYADYDLIYQVIFNLTDNAIKFTNNGGEISFNICRDDAGITFAIRNTGSYIPKEELSSIFERFYKVDKSRSYNKNGTGLGLYISKTIIDIHGGRLSADSREGEYTEFRFLINDIKTEA